MTKEKYLNRKIDPELSALLAEMREVPPRDPQVAAQRQARYHTQLNQALQGEAITPKKNFIEKLQENFNMTSPKTKTLITTAAIMLTVIVFLFSSAGITAVAAARSLPGDPHG